jgi:hypothetical protein
VAATKQVNSSKVSKEVSIFVNPVVTAVTVNQEIETTTRGVVLTLQGGGQFVAGPLAASDFLIYASGTNKTAVNDATSGLTSGLQVVRESNNTVRLYGFEPAASNDDVTIEIASKALRFLPTSVSAAVDAKVGIATIGANATTTNLTITPSGVVSGNFIITLSDDTFEASGASEINSGVNLLLSGITATINGKTIKAGSGLEFIPYVLDNSGTMIVQLSGILTGFTLSADVPATLAITVKNEVLTDGGVNLVVLLGNEQRQLIAKPRLTLALLE